MLLQFSDPQKKSFKTDLLVLGLWKPKGKSLFELSGLSARIDRQMKRSLSQILKREGFSSKVGETRLLNTDGQSFGAASLLIVGLGKKEKFKTQVIRKLGALAVRAGNKVGAKKVSFENIFVLKKKGVPSFAELLAEGILLGNYSFDRYKSKENLSKKTVKIIEILSSKSKKFEKGFKSGRHLGEATNYARDLINTPACDMTPRKMLLEAKKVSRRPRVTLKVLDQKKCEKLGMGSYLAVSKGSQEPPYLLHLTYRPRGRVKGRVALVGKGVTFDSGGLSLKNPVGMETMKFDMSGSAAVVALMQVLPDLNIPVEVHCIAAMTENMPSGSAGKPGDVAKTMNGKTVEILNTDAEGRLTLADAIAYALRQKPDTVIDIATLTGACVVALGDRCSGIMGNNQKLVDQLLQSSQTMGENLWQLPLLDEYRASLKSSVADIKNIGARWGGAIVAGLFLQHFVDSKIPWAHIDIAGPGWSEQNTALDSRGGTGCMVRTLIHFLQNY